MISADEAYAHCAAVARNHYENFPVASVLVPLGMRKHLFAIYAFSRQADDIADEPWTLNDAERIDQLDEMSMKLDGLVSYEADPVFIALHHTIRECKLPLSPFQRLLTAFKSDVNFVAPQSWDNVLTYCSNSACPVGELFLRLSYAGDEPPAEAIIASDAVCTALQITNFLQDVGLDLERGRTYLPLPNAEVLYRTRELFAKGASVTRYVTSWRLKLELRAIIAGGRTILDYCEQRADRNQRPTLGAMAILRIVGHMGTS